MIIGKFVYVVYIVLNGFVNVWDCRVVRLKL